MDVQRGGGRRERRVPYRSGALGGGEGPAVSQGGPGAQLALQEHLLAAGVAPHSQRGQVHRQVVARLLHTGQTL